MGAMARRSRAGNGVIAGARTHEADAAGNRQAAKGMDYAAVSEAIKSMKIQQKENYRLNFAPHKFATDARREGRRCIGILQALRNEADAAKSCGLFFANKSGF